MPIFCEFNHDCVRQVVRPFQSALLLSAIAFTLMPVARMEGQNASELSSSQETPRIVNRVDNSELTTVRGTTHPAVRSAIDNGRLAPREAMTDLILVLKRSEAQQAALESFNAQQYDPTSPEYHHWLTPAEFGANYGISESDLETVTNWLQSQGFSIEEIPPSRSSIRFSGNVAQVENAFHTEMHSITSGGVAHIANVSDISIPTALAPVVVGVKSLHNFFAKPQHHALSPSGQSALSGPALANGQAASVNLPNRLEGTAVDAAGLGSVHPGYTPGNGYQLLVPYDMATIYNYKSLWTAPAPINGTGQTIALAGTSNIVLSDVATFRAATGLPANVPRVIVTNTDPGTTNLLDDRFENTLDVEWSGAAAPGASIVLVTSSQTSQTTDALYASESYIINNNVAKIMSVSYGECELGMGTAGNQEYASLWQQAYTQGIAVFVSSGDSIAAVCDDGDYNPSADYAAEFGLSVSGMTSTPYNVSVGGTDFNSSSANWSGANNSVNMSNATGYIPEVPWDDTVTNPIVISSFNSQLGVNYSAEQWANYLLKNDGIGSGLYEEVIPPVGGSGGVSNCTTSNGSTPSSCSGGYAKPSWQTGVTGILSTDKRTVPDVSLFASNGFLGVTYLICDTQPPGYSSPIPCSYPAYAMDMAVGGTSVSSPIMAGIMALINQKAGSSQGNPNAVLYGLAAKQTYSNCSAETTANSSSCYFNDINSGTIAPICYGGTTNCTPQTAGDVLGVMPGYAATAGYDKATGLGSLNVANVVNGWPGVSTSPAPIATLSANSLTFSSTAVSSSSAAQTVTLTNSGSASMTVTGVSITGTNATSFSQTNTCGSSLAVNASCSVTVTFKPAASGALTASLSFADNAANSPQTVTLSGTGAAATTVSVSITPSSLIFPSTAINTASASQTVTFTNTGTAAVTFTGSPSITGTYNYLFKGATSCGGNATLSPGSSCVVTFTFNPTAAGSFTATLNFYDTAPNSPQTVALSGTGAGVPAVSLSPTSLTFASTNIGSTTAAQAVTLKNTGTAALTISGVSITGANAVSFSQSNNCGTSLAVSATCTVSVAFQPAAIGAASASLSISDNASGAAQTVSLSGTGVGVPAVSLSPTSLTFASTNVGSTSAAQSVTLKNTGTGALTISSVTFGGANAGSYSQTNTCGTSLAASASCAISVTFKPTAVGAAPASLSIADNASNTATAQTVALSGTGVGVPVVSLSPTSLTFASTYVGSTSAAQAVTLKNTGTAGLTITSFSFTGAYATSYSQTNTCGTSLAANASCTISVIFKPTAGGTLTASLNLADNAQNTPQSVSLSGTGVVPMPVVTLSTTSQSFPVTAVNPSAGYAWSPAQSITLTNTGTAALNLTSIAMSGTNPTSFSQINNCPGSLAVSASCTILTRFAPTALGSRAATLVFTDNASPATQSVALTGTGVSAPTLTLSANTLSFGTVTPGTTSATQAVIVTNSSTTTPVNLTSIALSGSGAASFVEVNNCGTTLAASSNCIVLIEFTPTVASATSATLTVTANNPSASATVALSGQ
ncbi:MAG: choice-of-anchor D domain-containing protein [Terracidiphilus sp.]